MPRPTPYAGTYQILRIDDRHAGRELLRRLIPYLASAASFNPQDPVALGVALSYQGLKALGVPEASLASFAPEFQQGMAARAAHLGDVGESAPEHWEKPLGSPDVHLVVVGLAQSDDHLTAALDHARDALRDLPGVVPIWQQDVHVPADLRNALGFADGISHPAVAGSGIPGTNPHEEPLKAGEFVLGYEDETYNVAPVPQPEVLGRNGTYVVFRKLHTRTAASASTCIRTPRTPPRRSGWAPRSSGAGRAGRRCPRAGQGRPRAGRRPEPQQRLPVRRRPAGPQVPGRLARPADEPARRGRHRRSRACTA